MNVLMSPNPRWFDIVGGLAILAVSGVFGPASAATPGSPAPPGGTRGPPTVT